MKNSFRPVKNVDVMHFSLTSQTCGAFLWCRFADTACLIRSHWFLPKPGGSGLPRKSGIFFFLSRFTNTANLPCYQEKCPSNYTQTDRWTTFVANNCARSNNIITCRWPNVIGPICPDRSSGRRRADFAGANKHKNYHPMHCRCGGIGMHIVIV